MAEISQRWRNVLICLCLVLVTTIVYWPVRNFEFVNYDDLYYVYENPQVQRGLTRQGLAWAFTAAHSDNWHPLTWLSHMLDCQLFGLDAGAHHLVNVVFHIANTLLLFGVLRRMTAAPWRSGFVAALFALHSLHVESVAWVAERKDVLSAFFWMLTMWAYVRYVETLNVQRSSLPTPRSPLHAFYGLALLFFALGLMAKPMVMTLPFALLLLDYWPLGRTPWAKPATGENLKIPPGRLLKEKLPFLALTVVSCGVTYWAQRIGGAIESLARLPVGDRIANAAVSYLRYLGKVFWPGGLAVFYPCQKWPVEIVAGAVAVLIALSVWAIRSARREPHFVTGWFWYLGTLVPVIGLVQVGEQSMADRYTYLPSIGLFMMAAWCVPSSAIGQRAGRMIAAATMALLLGACAVLSRSQVRHWRNSVTLFRHALAVTKDNYVAHLNLGVALAQAGRVEEAVEHLEDALRIKPGYADVHFNLGLALVLLGKIPEAMSHWEQALRIRPGFAKAHYNLGLVLWQAGKTQGAIGHFKQALRIQPDYAEAHVNLGLALEQTGNPREAIGHYEQALRIKPDTPEVQNNLAWLLATLAPADGGDPVRAVTLAERACALTGHRVAPYLDTLAAADAAAGRFNDAIATAQKAIELARAAGQPQVASEIEAHLELYRAGHPYRRPRTPVQGQSVDVTSPHNP